MEPRIFKTSSNFGDRYLRFEGEKYGSDPILDTKVILNGETLCWIEWEKKEEFAKKLNEVLSQYMI